MLGITQTDELSVGLPYLVGDRLFNLVAKLGIFQDALKVTNHNVNNSVFGVCRIKILIIWNWGGRYHKVRFRIWPLLLERSVGAAFHVGLLN